METGIPSRAFGGAASGGSYFIGGVYRQANFSRFKLMKVGLDQQFPFRMVPYVHPAVRFDIGYARIFDGSIYLVESSPRQGLFFTFGVGVRVPIVRWVSFLATFDFTYIGLFGSGIETVVHGSQLGGTFALTFHFFGVDAN